MKISEIENGTEVSINIRTDKPIGTLKAIKQETYASNIIIIDLIIDTAKPLNFDNVKVDLLCTKFDGPPLIWRKVQIKRYNKKYYLLSNNDGVISNRRECFRTSILLDAELKTADSIKKVEVKDMSLSGFAIIDKDNKLDIAENEPVSLTLQDRGYTVELKGRMIRKDQKNPTTTIYGFVITNLCKDLSSYLSFKQRKK